GEIVLAGHSHAVRYPAEFMLVLAARQCPCEGNGQCDCTPLLRRRYLARLTELLQRVEIRTRVEPLHWPAVAGESSAPLAPRAVVWGTARCRGLLGGQPGAHHRGGARL